VVTVGHKEIKKEFVSKTEANDWLDQYLGTKTIECETDYDFRFDSDLPTT